MLLKCVNCETERTMNKFADFLEWLIKAGWWLALIGMLAILVGITWHLFKLAQSLFVWN